MSAFLIGILLAGTGCATTVVAPVEPEQPTDIYLVDHGRHASLLLPDEDGTALIEFAYGDWNWFALGRTGPLDMFPTLFWPTQGALGRWEWPAFADAEAVDGGMPCQEVHALVVPRQSAARLRDRLETRFQSNIDTRHESHLYSLVFVHDDRAYSLLHGCNTVMEQWLRELDCEVRGCALVAKYEIRTEPHELPLWTPGVNRVWDWP